MMLQNFTCYHFSHDSKKSKNPGKHIYPPCCCCIGLALHWTAWLVVVTVISEHKETVLWPKVLYVSDQTKPLLWCTIPGVKTMLGNLVLSENCPKVLVQNECEITVWWKKMKHKICCYNGAGVFTLIEISCFSTVPWRWSTLHIVLVFVKISYFQQTLSPLSISLLVLTV